MENQYNINSGPAVNIQGDSNTVNQQNHAQLVDEFIATLREHGENKYANELADAKKNQGARSALVKGSGWVSERVFSESVLAALIPIMAQAVGVI